MVGARFTSNKGGILITMVLRWLRGEAIPSSDPLEGSPDGVQNKEAGDPIQATATWSPINEQELEMIVRVIWDTKCDVSTKWFFRVTFQMFGKTPVGQFSVKSFSSDNVVFFNSLSVPVKEWMKMLDDLGHNISMLFRTSRCYKDVSMVKKNLSMLF